MPPAIIGGVIAGAGAIGAAALSSSAQKKASKKAAEAQKDVTGAELQIAQNQEKLFRDIYAKNETNFQPYLNSGYGAQAVAMQLLGLKPLTADQFNKGQWYLPGTVNYTPPATPTPTPTPTPGTGTGTGAGTGTGTGTAPKPLVAKPSPKKGVQMAAPVEAPAPAPAPTPQVDPSIVQQQALQAIAAGADPASVAARFQQMGGMPGVQV